MIIQKCLSFYPQNFVSKSFFTKVFLKTFFTKIKWKTTMRKYPFQSCDWRKYKKNQNSYWKWSILISNFPSQIVHFSINGCIKVLDFFTTWVRNWMQIESISSDDFCIDSWHRLTSTWVFCKRDNWMIMQECPSLVFCRDRAHTPLH